MPDVDKLIAAADGLYHRSDAMQNGTWSDSVADADDPEARLTRHMVNEAHAAANRTGKTQYVNYYKGDITGFRQKVSEYKVSSGAGHQLYEAKPNQPKKYGPRKDSSRADAFTVIEHKKVTLNHGSSKVELSLIKNKEGDGYTYEVRVPGEVLFSGHDEKQARAVFNTSAKKWQADSAADATGCTFILVDGKVDQVIQHTGNYKAIIEREVKDLKKMDAGRVTTKVFEYEEQGYAKYDSVRGDANPRSMTLAQAKAEYARRHKKIEDQLRRDLDKASRSNVRDFGTAFNNDMKVKAQARFTQAENDLAKELLWWRPEYGGRKDSSGPSSEAEAEREGKANAKQGTNLSHSINQMKKAGWPDNIRAAWVRGYKSHGAQTDSEPTTLDALLSVADELYERSDAVARGDADEHRWQVHWQSKSGKRFTSVVTASSSATAKAKVRDENRDYDHTRDVIKDTPRKDSASPQPGDQVTIKKEAFERLRAGGYNGPRVARVKEYRGSDLVLSNGQRVKPADVD